MGPLGHKLCEIRDAWREGTLKADEYKAAVLQAIREFTNTPAPGCGAVECLVETLSQDSKPAKTPLVWNEMLGAQYCTGKINNAIVKVVLTSNRPSGTNVCEFELWTICATGRNWINRCYGYLADSPRPDGWYITGSSDLPDGVNKYTIAEAEAQIKGLAEYLFNS